MGISRAETRIEQTPTKMLSSFLSSSRSTTIAPSRHIQQPLSSLNPFLSLWVQTNRQPHHHEPQQQQTRYKHSRRQVRRLLNDHPAALRVRSRLQQQQRKSKNNNSVDISSSELDTVRYPPSFKPTFLPNGWSAPPSPPEIAQAMVQHLPFTVERTGNKPNGAVGFLPVYKDVRIGGSKVTTLVRRVTGDRDEFIRELRVILNMSPTSRLPSSSIPSSSLSNASLPSPNRGRGDGIRYRAHGTVFEVDGNRTREIKTWLAGLGF